MFTVTNFFFNIVVEVLATAVRKKKYTEWGEKGNTTICNANNTTVYIEHPKNSRQKLTELLSRDRL